MKPNPAGSGAAAGSIRGAELFRRLSGEELDYVASRSDVFRLKKNGRLFSAAQKADRFYILVEGSVRVYRCPEEGGEMAVYAPGDAVGDCAFVRGAEYGAFAEAAEDSSLVAFPAAGFSINDCIAEKPEIVSRILLNSIAMTTSRIKDTQKSLLEKLSWAHELHRRAYEDPGTGLWKQAFLDDEIDRLLENPTALILLKPDRFKILVDSRGHGTGDEAMLRIAKILRGITRRLGKGWPLRLKSNETGILIGCGGGGAEETAREVSRSIAALEPLPALDGVPEFSFSGTVVWALWPEDGENWEELFAGCYAFLLESWRRGGGTTLRYGRGQ